MHSSNLLAEYVDEPFAEWRLGRLRYLVIVVVNPLLVLLDVADVVACKHTGPQMGDEAVQSVLAVKWLVALE